jgi:hypothetical protein
MIKKCIAIFVWAISGFVLFVSSIPTLALLPKFLDQGHSFVRPTAAERFLEAVVPLASGLIAASVGIIAGISLYYLDNYFKKNSHLDVQGSEPDGAGQPDNPSVKL